MAATRSMINDLLEGPNGTVFAIVAASVVVFLTLVLFFLLGHSRSKGRSILLVGLTDSGKTLLFSRLLDTVADEVQSTESAIISLYAASLSTGKSVMTHTSMTENKAVYTFKGDKAGKTAEIVDLPGYERLRGRFLEQYKDQARGIIFIIDSANFPRELRDVADFMYDVLSTKRFTACGTPILVVCNKQDLTTAKSHSVIKAQLQKEINTLRVTRAAALQGLDGSTHTAYIGKKGKDFEFGHVHPIKVDFVESSVKGNAEGEAEIGHIEKWMKTLV